LKLPSLTGKGVEKIIERMGFVYSHTRGSHAVYKAFEQESSRALAVG